MKKVINKVILVGRLTKAMSLSQTANGRVYTRFTLAVSRRSTRADTPDADFISCVAWGKTAEIMYQHLHKGSLIGLEGKIQTGSYLKNDETIYTTDVVVDYFAFLERKSQVESQESKPNDSDDSIGINSDTLPV